MDNTNMIDPIDDIMGFNPSAQDAFNEPTRGSFNQNIYKTNPKDSKSSDGHYRSTLRIVYNPFNFKRSIVNQATYSMTDADGFFLVRSSLSEGDRNCPIFKAWKKLWFSGDESKKEFAKSMFDKTESRWVLVQILSDDNQPDMVGKFKAMKLPKAIYDKLVARMNPAAETKKAPVAVMDYLIGLPLEMDVAPGEDGDARRTSYTLCDFDADSTPIIAVDGNPFFNDDELELIEQFTSARAEISKNKSKAKVEAAQKTLTEINDQIRDLYKKALDYIKENAFDLVEECAFKEWDEATTARVEKWIDSVLRMEDPKNNDGLFPSNPTTTNVPDPFAEAADSAGIEDPAESSTDVPF